MNAPHRLNPLRLLDWLVTGIINWLARLDWIGKSDG